MIGSMLTALRSLLRRTPAVKTLSLTGSLWRRPAANSGAETATSSLTRLPAHGLVPPTALPRPALRRGALPLRCQAARTVQCRARAAVGWLDAFAGYRRAASRLGRSSRCAALTRPRSQADDGKAQQQRRTAVRCGVLHADLRGRRRRPRMLTSWRCSASPSCLCSASSSTPTLQHRYTTAWSRLRRPLCIIFIPLLYFISRIVTGSLDPLFHGVPAHGSGSRWLPKLPLGVTGYRQALSPKALLYSIAASRRRIWRGISRGLAPFGQLWPLAPIWALQCRQHLLPGHLQRRADGAARLGPHLLARRHRLPLPFPYRDAGVDGSSAALAPLTPASPRDARHHGVPRARNLRAGLPSVA